MKELCPNLNNKEVKQEFDELVANVGENAAYVIWSENDGNGIDKAPNGAQSKLFLDLLRHYNGDRSAAIKAKAKTFASSFKIRFKDSNLNDINGESLVDTVIKSSENTISYAKQSDQMFQITDAVNSHIFPAFRNLTDSPDVLQKLIDEGLVPDELVELTKKMMKYHVPVHFISKQDVKSKDLAIYDPMSGITVYPKAFNNDDLAATFLHEMIHFYTVAILANPKTEAEQKFEEDMTKAYNEYKAIRATDDIYGFIDVMEFVSEIQTNQSFRDHLNNKHQSLYIRVLNFFKSLLNGFKTPSMSVQQINDAITDVITLGNQNGVRLTSNRWQHHKQLTPTVSESELLYAKIIKGLKQRLNAIRRYNVDNKRAQNEYTITKLIEDLSKADSTTAIVDFIQHINETVGEAISFLNSDITKLNSKQLVQLRRDYLNYYQPMLQQVASLVQNTDELNNIPNFSLFEANVDDLISKFNRIQVRYDRVLRTKTREFLSDYAEQSGSPFTDEMLNWIDNPNNDIGWIGYYVGMSSNTDNEVVRIMENMIRNVKNKVNRHTRTVGQTLLPLLSAAKAKHGNNVMELLQERDSNGKRTGYFVRSINYGMYYKNRSAMYEKLAVKYGLTKDESGIYNMPTDPAIKQKYDADINDWMSQNVERLFTKEYYTLKDQLLPITKQVLGDINEQIQLLKSKYTKNKVYYNHKMSPQDKVAMQVLQRQKSALYNIYDINGNDKTGDDLIIAQDLQKFKLATEDNVKYTRSSKKFMAALAKMRALLPDVEYAEWYKSNTHSEYSDEFWRLLDSLDSVEQDDDYKELKVRQRAIMQMFRKENSMQIDATVMDKASVAAVKDMDEQLALRRTRRGEDEQYDDSAPKFSDYAEIVVTNEYNKAYTAASAAGQFQFEKWYEENHYEDASGRSKPISIWTYLRPIDNKYLEHGVPNSDFSEVSAQSKFLNHNYDQYGEYIQPKLSLYNNQTNYKKIVNSVELKALYDELIHVMEGSTRKIGFLQHSDPYKLPQMTARTFQMVVRDSSVLKGLKYAVADSFGIKDDDVDYVDEFQLSPDGTPIKNIPTRYLNLLDNTDMITADVVGSVIEFFNMADNFQEMTNVQDDIEMILNRLSQLEVVGKKGKTPGELNVFRKAQQLVDMGVYGQKKQRVNVDVFGKKIELSKGLGTMLQYFTKVNLAFNMWAIGTNYVTGQGYTDMESILGRYYSKSDVLFAKAELMKYMPTNTKNIGNVDAKNKLLSLMQLNQVTRANADTYDRLDNSTVLRAINQHFWFNGYTAGDFVVKAQVLAAVYHNYKLYNGEFLSQNQFLSKYHINDKKAGKIAYDKLKTSLYDAYDNNGQVKSKYVDMISVKLQNEITNKINTLAQKIDGNLSDTDRSAIHANAFAQFLVMHRNFMIVGIQDRFKKRQFNYNTGEVEVGVYRSAGKLIQQQFSNDKWYALKQLMDNYNNLEDYEKYNVKKVMLEVMNATVLALAVSYILLPLADSGDGEDLWAMQAVTYLAMRAAFEFRTLYNPLELVQLLNSPSAAFNTVEQMANMIKLLWIPNWFGGDIFKKVDRGAYKGMPSIMKNFIKFTPAKNVIEATDPKPKRSYLENQLMV